METVQRGIAARRMAEVPKYADGGTVSPYSIRGIVNGAKKMLEPTPPETMTAKYARQDAERAAKQPPKPVEAPVQKPDVIDVIKNRNALMGSYADGGQVKAGIIRGKGTGTSDSIKGTMPIGSFVMPKDSTDVMVSNGETNFTPEMVQSIGAAALMAAKDLTHTPMAEQAPAFKNGGAVKRMMGISQKPMHLAEGGKVEDKAVFGFYPQLTGNRLTSYATEEKLKTGYTGENATPAVTQTSIPSGNSTAGAGRGFVNPSVDAPVASQPSALSYGISPGAPQAGTGRGFVNQALVNPSAPAPASPLTKVDLGNGITKTTGGSSPLFSNVGDADNASLMGRGKVSAQNQLALNGIQARQDTADAATQQRLQYQSEVNDATAFREGQAQAGIQRRALNGNRNALSLLQGQANDATARRGQDLTAKSQASQDQNAAARLGIERSRLGIEQTNAGLQNQQTTQQIGASKQMQDLQARLLTAKPEERAVIEDNLRALQGKYEKPAAAEQFGTIQTGEDPMTGSKTFGTFNKQTGQVVQQQGQAPAALPPKDKLVKGQAYATPRGQAVWNGSQFTPI